MMYLILNKQRVGDLALWWRPNRCGYTVNVDTAGRYSKEEAESIARIRGEDWAIPEEVIGPGLRMRRVVSVEDGANFQVLKDFQSASAHTQEAKL